MTLFLPPRGRPWIFGHRGSPRVEPENTLRSFRAAFAAGADGIECDVHLSAEGRAVVLHDRNLQALTGHGRTPERTPFADLRCLRMARRKLDLGATGRVPTPREVRRMLPEGKRVIFELKGASTASMLGSGPALLREFGGRSDLRRVAVASFRPGHLVIARAFFPTLPIAFVSRDAYPVDLLRVAERLDCRMLLLYHRRVDRAYVRNLQRRGWHVLAWTPDRPADWRRCLAARTDGILTNRPDRLARFLGVEATRPPRGRLAAPPRIR